MKREQMVSTVLSNLFIHPKHLLRRKPLQRRAGPRLKHSSHISARRMNDLACLCNWSKPQEVNKRIYCAVKKKDAFAHSELSVQRHNPHIMNHNSVVACAFQPRVSNATVHLIYDNDGMLDYVLLISDSTQL